MARILKFIKESITLSAVFVYAIFICLQIFPITGIFLMMMLAVMGPYVWGFLPHLLIVALLADIYRKTLPKIFVVIPIVLYGGYYFIYASEYNSIRVVENELRAENPHEILAYKPESNSLVIPDAENFVSRYKIPVAYTPNSNFPEGYLAYRLVRQESCRELRNAGIIGLKTLREGYLCIGVHWVEPGHIIGDFLTSVTRLQLPEHPEKDIINVSTESRKDEQNLDEKRYKLNFINLVVGQLPESAPISEQIYNFSHAGQLIGSFKLASTAILPIFPFFIVGCGLNDSPAEWRCFASFYRSPKGLDTYPKGINHDLYGYDPIGVMLKIPQYQRQELDKFTDFEENAAKIKHLIDLKNNESPADYDEWGIRKDSAYLPQLDQINDVPRFKGVIYTRKEGGPFYKFIKDNEGKIVYLDATINPNVNINREVFGIFGVCKDEDSCVRTDHIYKPVSANGSVYEVSSTMRTATIKGYWLVGPEETTSRGTKHLLTGVSASGYKDQP